MTDQQVSARTASFPHQAIKPGAYDTLAEDHVDRLEAEMKLRIVQGMFLPSDLQSQDVVALSDNNVNEPFTITNQSVFRNAPVGGSSIAVVWMPWYGIKGLFFMRQVSTTTITAVSAFGFTEVPSVDQAPPAGNAVGFRFLNPVFLPSTDGIEQSPDLSATFARGRFIQGRVSVSSKATSLANNALTGVVNYGAIQDVRGLLTLKPASLVQQSLTKHDGGNGIPVQTGATFILGPDIKPVLSPLDEANTYGFENSGIANNILPNPLPFQPVFQNIIPSGTNAQPGIFSGAVFFTPRTAGGKLVARTSPTAVGDLPGVTTVLTEDLGFTQTPKFRFHIQVPKTFLTMLPERGGPLDSGPHSGHAYAPMANILLLHLWAFTDSQGNVTVTTVEETAALTPTACSDSLRFVTKTSIVPQNPSASDPNIETQDYLTVWESMARRPLDFDKAVWVGTFVRPQVMDGDNFAAVQVTYATEIHPVSVLPMGYNPATDSAGPVNTNVSFGQYVIRRVDLIATNVYELGNLGPSRVVTVTNADPAQNITVEGKFVVQAIASTALVPFVAPAKDWRVTGKSLLGQLNGLFDSIDNHVFQRIYSGTPDCDENDCRNEWMHVERWARSLTVEDFLGEGSTTNPMAQLLRSSGLFGRISKIIAPIAKNVLRSALPVVSDFARQQGHQIVDKGVDWLQQQAGRLTSCGQYGDNKDCGAPHKRLRSENTSHYTSSAQYGSQGVLPALVATVAPAVVDTALKALTKSLIGAGSFGASVNLGDDSSPQGIFGAVSEYGDLHDDALYAAGKAPHPSSGRLLPSGIYASGENVGIFSQRNGGSGMLLTPTAWKKMASLAAFPGLVSEDEEGNQFSYVPHPDQVIRAALKTFLQKGHLTSDRINLTDETPIGWWWLTRDNFKKLDADAQKMIQNAGVHVAETPKDRERLMVLQGVRLYGEDLVPAAAYKHYVQRLENLNKIYSKLGVSPEGLLMMADTDPEYAQLLASMKAEKDLAEQELRNATKYFVNALAKQEKSFRPLPSAFDSNPKALVDAVHDLPNRDDTMEEVHALRSQGQEAVRAMYRVPSSSGLKYPSALAKHYGMRNPRGALTLTGKQGLALNARSTTPTASSVWRRLQQ